MSDLEVDERNDIDFDPKLWERFLADCHLYSLEHGVTIVPTQSDFDVWLQEQDYDD